MERGTYFPLPVSVKKVSQEPPSATSFASGSGRPSAFKPCSRRYLKPQCQSIVVRWAAVGGGAAEAVVVRRGRGLQLPGTVTELGTSLADVKVADLGEREQLAVVSELSIPGVGNR